MLASCVPAALKTIMEVFYEAATPATITQVGGLAPAGQWRARDRRRHCAVAAPLHMLCMECWPWTHPARNLLEYSLGLSPGCDLSACHVVC